MEDKHTFVILSSAKHFSKNATWSGVRADMPSVLAYLYQDRFCTLRGRGVYPTGYKGGGEVAERTVVRVERRESERRITMLNPRKKKAGDEYGKVPFDRTRPEWSREAFATDRHLDDKDSPARGSPGGS